MNPFIFNTTHSIIFRSGAAKVIDQHLGALLGYPSCQWQFCRVAGGRGHLGQVLAAMRHTFAQAYTASPAILTIDENDAIGSRGDSDDHARNYRVQVINGFLEQMDTISRKEGVIVIGTCNNRERIDPAILRAGRFDLHIEIGRPGPAVLAQILHDKLGRDFDLAAITDLARTALALPPQHDALDWRIAIHEAGHAVVCAALDLGQISRITLTPQGGEIARTLPQNETLLANMEDEIGYTLAGRAAEHLIFGEVSAGAGGGEESNLAIATRIDIMIETAYGLGSQGPIWSGMHEIGKLDAEGRNLVRARVRAGEDRAATILQKHRDHLIALARNLQQRRHLSGDDLHRHGLGGPDPEAERPAQERRAVVSMSVQN